jgi:aspartyl protease family protein
MDLNTVPPLIYLGILLVVIGSYVLAAGRRNPRRAMQHGATWVFVFIAAVTLAGLWSEGQMNLPRQTVIQQSDDTVVTTMRAPDGHYYLTLTINSAPIRFVVDTGATDLVLTLEDAARVGIDMTTLRFSGVAHTANGQTRTATVRLDTVALGGLTDQDVRAVVNQGQMNGSLLGMNYLQHFGRIEIADNRLSLTR